MDDLCTNMQSLIEDSLDSLVSARSIINRRTQALDDLEQLVARIFASTAEPASFELFNLLQDTFECNIPSRLIDWISSASLRLDHLLSRGVSDCDKGTEAAALSAQLIQALSLVQGVSLIHNRSKDFLGRKYSLEVLVDLLWVSRHSGVAQASPASSNPSTPSSKTKSTPTGLASAVLDTLLCVLVDSSSALRVFERASGVQTVVKLLKRPNALREVKMKCLEFLYFYLLDETTQPAAALQSVLPPTPLSPSPFITCHTDRHHSMRDASSSSDDSYSSGSNSWRSTSSASSATSSSSAAETSPKTPPRSPMTADLEAKRLFAKPRALLLLQKDVDFVPLSPKKAQVIRLGVGASTPVKGGCTSANTPLKSLRTPRQVSEGTGVPGGGVQGCDARTTEQKKEFLGTMLGNVDALVAGVRNAGVALG
ncbi:cell division protein Cdc14 [Vararia minispora EC-137]|uniref:Cell division protein Cdc14 n=1 Tax=Vararia minispora EC-137 TaxID=1314806 RepID=A0ACB8QQZ4_9AGAM|nr:cell division protein Cdc14 [Vararia minispora EC-137]